MLLLSLIAYLFALPESFHHTLPNRFVTTPRKSCCNSQHWNFEEVGLNLGDIVSKLYNDEPLAKAIRCRVKTVCSHSTCHACHGSRCRGTVSDEQCIHFLHNVLIPVNHHYSNASLMSETRGIGRHRTSPRCNISLVESGQF